MGGNMSIDLKSIRRRRRAFNYAQCLDEPLERRVMLDGAAIIHGILKITGSGAADEVIVDSAGPSTVVTLHRLSSPPRSYIFRSADISGLLVDVSNGDDV